MSSPTSNNTDLVFCVATNALKVEGYEFSLGFKDAYLDYIYIYISLQYNYSS